MKSWIDWKHPKLDLQFDWKLTALVWAVLIIAFGIPILAWVTMR